MKGSQIILSPDPKGKFEEGDVVGALLPGTHVEIVPVRAWKEIRTRTSKLEVWSSSTRRRPILLSFRSGRRPRTGLRK